MRWSPAARRAPHRWLVVACLAAAPVVGSAAGAPLDLRVTFAGDGTCRILVDGDAVSSPRSPIPVRDDVLRCALPRLAPGRAVGLVVTLPPAFEPADSSFPNLAWSRTGAAVTGAATVPAAPALVYVPREGSATARDARWLDALVLAAAALGVVLAVAWGRRA